MQIQLGNELNIMTLWHYEILNYEIIWPNDVKKLWHHATRKVGSYEIKKLLHDGSWEIMKLRNYDKTKMITMRWRHYEMKTFKK